MIEWIGKHKVRLTITVGFLLVSILGGGSVVYVLNSLKRAQSHSHQLFNASLIPASLSEQLVKKTYELEELKIDLSKDGAHQIDERFDEISYYLNEIISSHKILTKDINNDLETRTKLFINDITEIHEVLESDVKNNSLIVKKLQMLDIKSYRKEIDEHLEYLKGIGLKEKSEIDLINTKSIKNGTILVILLVAISFFIFIVLLKEVISKISDMRELCNEIRNGNLNKRLPIYKGRSELNLLATSYNQMLNSLVNSLGKLDGIFKSIQEYLILFDRESSILMANSYFYGQTGFTVEEIEGSSISTLFGKDLAVECKNGLVNYETHFAYKNGDVRLVDLSCLAIESEDVNSGTYLIVAQDITIRRENERKLKEQEAQILQSSKLAALGEMAGGVAHEINNPLAVITGSTKVMEKMIKMGKTGTEDFQKILKSITDMAIRISKITEGMRVISKDPSKDDFENCIIEEIVDDVFSLFQTKFKNAGIDFSIQISEELKKATISCMKVQLSQVLINMLSNAFDAVSETSRDDKSISFRLVFDKKRFVFEINDNGVGIPEDLRTKVFQPFFTTKKIGKGTGIGLGISKAIVENHGGSFYLDTSKEMTSFIAEIPVDRESA